MSILFSGNFPKLSVVNSFSIKDKIIYHKKVKSGRFYYDYETKKLLGFSFDNKGKTKVGLSHEEFIKFLEEHYDDIL